MYKLTKEYVSLPVLRLSAAASPDDGEDSCILMVEDFCLSAAAASGLLAEAAMCCQPSTTAEQASCSGRASQYKYVVPMALNTDTTKYSPTFLMRSFMLFVLSMGLAKWYEDLLMILIKSFNFKILMVPGPLMKFDWEPGRFGGSQHHAEAP
ncbi:hypothetical protein AK812_SmicGene27997 [Symbiodinium microadriaticum]|uniref:Uncharacterized protein n=1 Tax=Symbiodinium microadriaticum TaxID=2951 RepID=A0A1Q9D5H8_SYMMI|nr:hypothetical protein AK812_SmicGene27997 [Symbiodinium microadriaticum]